MKSDYVSKTVRFLGHFSVYCCPYLNHSIFKQFRPLNLQAFSETWSYKIHGPNGKISSEFAGKFENFLTIDGGFWSLSASWVMGPHLINNIVPHELLWNCKILFYFIFCIFFKLLHQQIIDMNYECLIKKPDSRAYENFLSKNKILRVQNKSPLFL